MLYNNIYFIGVVYMPSWAIHGKYARRINIPPEAMFLISIGAMISGGTYGFLSSLAVKSVKH